VTSRAIDDPLRFRITKGNPASQLLPRIVLVTCIACGAGAVVLVATGLISVSNGAWLMAFFLAAWLVVTLTERFMGSKEVLLFHDRLELRKLLTRDSYRLEDLEASATSLGSQGMDTRVLGWLLRLDLAAPYIELRVSRSGLVNALAPKPTKVQLYVESPEELLSALDYAKRA
jgi:hypothetical protein